LCPNFRLQGENKGHGDNFSEARLVLNKCKIIDPKFGRAKKCATFTSNKTPRDTIIV
jgi:hypothetical protein